MGESNCKTINIPQPGLSQRINISYCFIDKTFSVLYVTTYDSYDSSQKNTILESNTCQLESPCPQFLSVTFTLKSDQGCLNDILCHLTHIVSFLSYSIVKSYLYSCPCASVTIFPTVEISTTVRPMIIMSKNIWFYLTL